MTPAIFAGGNSPSNSQETVIDFFEVATLGNAQDFGDLSDSSTECRGSASRTRFVFNFGFTPSVSNVIEFVQFATKANSQDFGDLTVSRGQAAGFSNGHGGL